MGPWAQLPDGTEPPGEKGKNEGEEAEEEPELASDGGD